MKEKFGIILIIIGVLFPIVATVVFFTEPSSMPLVAKIGFLCRYWVTAPILGGIGAKLVWNARRHRMLRKIEELKASSCKHCRFADKTVMLTGQNWCKSPSNPTIDEKRAICFSVELAGKTA